MVLTGERMILNRMKKETEIEHICRYEYAKNFVEGKKVLDAACGSGYGTSMLAEKAGKVIGMDISSETIEYAIQNYKKHNSEYLVGSVEKLPFDDDEFDVIVSFETIEHVNEEIQKSFLNEIERVLKEDGILIMSTPNKRIFTDERSGGESSEYHVKEFYADEFRAFLKRKFKYVEFNQQYYAKTVCIVEEKSRMAELQGFEEDGMYIVAVASKQEIQNEKSFFMRYPKEYEAFNDYLQVFFSSGEPYSEEFSQIVELDNRKKEHNIQVTLGGIECSRLRIDPISEVGSVKIKLIEIELEGGKKEVITDYCTNTRKNGISSYECISEDLQIYVELAEMKKIQCVNVNFEIEAKEKIITLLREIDEENDVLKEQMKNLQVELTNIKNSKTWKFMQMIGKILHGKKEGI